MIFGALALTVVAGWLLAPARTSAGVFPRACFAFGSGAAALSFQLFVYSLAGLPWNPLLLIVPWVAGAGVVLVRFRSKITAPKWRTPAWWETLLLLAAFAPIAVWGPLERLMPLTSQAWDAWAIWLLKARAFYLDGSIEPNPVGPDTTMQAPAEAPAPAPAAPREAGVTPPPGAEAPEAPGSGHHREAVFVAPPMPATPPPGETILDELERNPEGLAGISHHKIMEEAGAEAVELIMWLTMRGALSPNARRVHRHYYAPMTTGMGLITFEDP